MNLSNPELETVLRCVDKVFDFSAERDRLRGLLATLEAENKVLAARVAELEARDNQAREDEAWAKSNDVTVATMPDGWIAFDSDVRRGVCGKTIIDSIRALREKMEAKP